VGHREKAKKKNKMWIVHQKGPPTRWWFHERGERIRYVGGLAKVHESCAGKKERKSCQQKEIAKELNENPGLSMKALLYFPKKVRKGKKYPNLFSGKRE